MGVIITKENNYYFLNSISHTPFFMNGILQDAWYSMNIGKLKNLNGLKINKEYKLDCYKDFKEIERIKQVKHEWGFSDDLTYDINIKSENWKQYKHILRELKVKNILS
jgi:hypothetical protein